VIDETERSSGDGLSSVPPEFNEADWIPPPAAEPGPRAEAVTTASGAMIVFEPGAGAQMTDLRSVDPPPDGLPAGASLPFGAFAFTLGVFPAGASTTMTIFLPDGAPQPDTYLRYGPEPGQPEPHWYDFSWDLETGAERVAVDRIVLHFVDGGRGDDDLTADGQIVDAGGAAQAENAPPAATATWRYGRYAPMTVHLQSTSTDPDGPIVATQWLTPEGRIVAGETLKWDAPGGPGGVLRRFVLAVSDGTTWSTHEIYIAVPPVMELTCLNRIQGDSRVVEFDGSSNYWTTYGWSTSVGTNQRFGDYDEASVWYEWDPGNGEPPIQGSINNIHQNDFDATYSYGERPEDPTRYIATLHAGAYKPGTTQKVELATCQTEVQFAIPVYDLFGTITFTRESHFGPGDREDRWTTEEMLTGTLVVAMRTHPERPEEFIDVSSTFQVERTTAASRENSGDCSPHRVLTTSKGRWYFTEGEPTLDGPGATQSGIWGFQDRERGMIAIGNVEYYPYQEQEVCALVSIPGLPEVVDSWSCGETYFGISGLGIEGFIIDQPSGPDRVSIDCTYEGPSFAYDTQKITAKGTLTITGH